MRNVQQWCRESDQRVVRVFRSGGKTKTLEAFLGGVYEVTNPKSQPGQIIHTSTNQYNICKDYYLVVNSTSMGFKIFKTEDLLFQYMLENKFGFIGVERVRNMQLNAEADNTEVVNRWVNWAHSREIVNLKFKQPSVEDLPVTDKKEECDIPPFGWKCSRCIGHTGPCAAIGDFKPEPPEFWVKLQVKKLMRLIGFTK